MPQTLFEAITDVLMMALTLTVGTIFFFTAAYSLLTEGVAPVTYPTIAMLCYFMSYLIWRTRHA